MKTFVGILVVIADSLSKQPVSVHGVSMLRPKFGLHKTKWSSILTLPPDG